MTFKPSDKESEYFARIDAENRKKLRENLDKKRDHERQKKEKSAHWMKCPKCDAELKEIKFLEVAIDECAKCGGVWLDQGELELLLKTEVKETARFFDRFFGKK